MIDVNSKLDLKEQKWQALESISACLKPIEMGISALCQRDSNLLAAEGIFQFIFNQLEIIDSEFALELLQHLRTIKLSIDFSLNCALNFVTKNPAAEKARSPSTLVGGIVLNARSTRFKYFDLFPFALNKAVSLFNEGNPTSCF